MLIKSISLKNIRSYDSLHISFNAGSTVLSGDIGSGKTTILMSLEFALFGILRGKTSPFELLRYGESNGEVILNCIIQDKEVIITRSLKKSSSNIVQTVGSISIDGVLEELTPTDLKAKVLTLLGYPTSLIAKSTNLFRYTVYTPQEQVKAILFETTEVRKDIIRNIFSIDSYNRVAQNITLYSSDVRERVAFLKGQTNDIKILKEQLQAQKRELDMYNLTLPKKEELFKKAHDLVVKKKLIVEKLEKDRLARVSKEKELDLIEQKIKSIKELILSLENQKTTFTKQLSELNITKIDFDPDKKVRFKIVLDQIKEKHRLLHNKFGSLIAKRELADSLVKQVESLTICPTCKQDVCDEHKDKIRLEQTNSLKIIADKEIKLKELQASLNVKEKEILEKQDIYFNLEKEFISYKNKLKQKETFQKNIVVIENQITDNKNLLKSLNTKLNILKLDLEKIVLVDSSKEKSELEALRSDDRIKEIELNELKTKISIASRQLDVLSTSINKKVELLNKSDELSSIYSWTKELFIPLVKTIEKRVMQKVYHDFNFYFQKWFDMLIEDESINVKLDEDFNPLIEQNGYDTRVLNLSGGEKTSLALAYRLALNKVLNDYFSSIHTKDLLILDEPTDGFSTEQLDKLRDVIDELNINQLIVVSHQQKLNSLAKHYIRIEKSNQSSKVLV